jgi:hypothetical protein
MRDSEIMGNSHCFGSLMEIYVRWLSFVICPQDCKKFDIIDGKEENIKNEAIPVTGCGRP